MDEHNPLSLKHNNEVLNILENGLYLTNTFVSANDVINKITEFSNFLNSTGRIALLNANEEEAQDLAFLLNALKKNIKSSLSELGKRNNKKNLNFLCPDCQENITIPPGSNIWESLQNHDHFEDLFFNFLTGNLQVLPLQSDSSDETEAVPQASDLHNNNNNNNEHTDSGIDQSEEQNDIDFHTPDEEPPLGDNSFKFYFKLKYDPIVESVIYPDSFTSMSKYDQCPYISVQKNSSFRAVCLLCSCDLLSTKRISKKQCLDHVLGNKHMKASTNPTNIENLQNYHEVFWSLDACYQAHQVYFEPKSTSGLLCRLCNAVIPNKYIIEHIDGSYHKGLVLRMFHQKSLEFYLLNVQVGCYGIELEKAVESPKKEKMEPKQETRRERKSSKPSTSKEEPDVEHIIIPSITNSGKNTMLDILPHRFHSHAKYFKNYTTFLNCSICNLNVSVNPKQLLKHIITTSHLKLADVKLPKFTFFCEICNMKFLEEVTWDKHFNSGQNRHSKVSKVRASRIMEYECTTCNTVIYGDEVSLTRHKNKATKKERGLEPYLPEVVKEIFSSKEKLEESATILAQEANDTVTCMQRTLECCIRLEAVLKTTLKDCTAHPFGSRVSGLGNQKSDLDLFIDTGDMYLGRKRQDSFSQCQIVKQVAGLFRKHRGEFEQIHEVPTARTPIVKLKHIGTQLECDLSFKHGLSVENTKFLRLCLDLQPISQQFILVLKKWSECNKLKEHITTYALAILAIFFLQVNGYLPSVKKLKELNPSAAPVIDGWETINYTMPTESIKEHVNPCTDSLAKLLKDFFSYYVNFNYAEDTVCPLLGHTIKRKLFEVPKSLPPDMVTYVIQLKGPDPEQFRFMSPFCIQDPFDLSHNLTKACQNTTLTTFIKLCQQSHQCLESL